MIVLIREWLAIKAIEIAMFLAPNEMKLSIAKGIHAEFCLLANKDERTKMNQKDYWVPEDVLDVIRKERDDYRNALELLRRKQNSGIALEVLAKYSKERL